MDQYSQYLDRVEDISAAIFDRTMQRGEYQLVGGFDKPNTLQYVANYLNAKAQTGKTITAQLLGSPGSGKTRFAIEMLPLLQNAILLATDEYNLGTREDRRKTIEKGGTPLDEKDFDLLAKHVDKLKSLSSGEKIRLPGPYNATEGTALINGLTREVAGQFRIVLIEGNFYVGYGGPANIPLEALVYLHISDRDRLKVRFARDASSAADTPTNADEIFEQFYSRQKIQDTPYTLPFMDISDILLFARPTFEGGVVARFDYDIYYRKTAPLR